MPAFQANLRHDKKHRITRKEVLAARVVRLYSDAGDVALNPFCGSGTTPAVAKRHKRNYIGMEIDEEYSAMAARRVRVANQISRRGIGCQISA